MIFYFFLAFQNIRWYFYLLLVHFCVVLLLPRGESDPFWVETLSTRYNPKYFWFQHFGKVPNYTGHHWCLKIKIKNALFDAFYKCSWKHASSQSLDGLHRSSHVLAMNQKVMNGKFHQWRRRSLLLMRCWFYINWRMLSTFYC